MKNIFFVTLFSFNAAICLADRQGNGGEGVACYNEQNQLTSVEMFDHFEARTRYQTQIDLSFAGATHQQKVDFILKNIGKINPSREAELRSELAHFWGNSNFVAGVDLGEIPDAGEILFPAGCHLVQVAIQKDPQFPADKFYTISKDLWDRMNEDSKAGLVLHEILYRLAIRDNQHKNSSAIRFFNFRISEQKFENIGINDYLNLLDITNLNPKSGTYLYKGIAFYKCQVVSRNASVCENSSGGNWQLESGLNVKISPNTPVTFGEGSSLAQISLAEPIQIVLFGNTVRINGKAAFQSDGRIFQGNIAEPVNFTLQSGIVLPLLGEFKTTNFGLQEATLATDFEVKRQGTCPFIGPRGSKVEFDEYGELKTLVFKESPGQFCIATADGTSHPISTTANSFGWVFVWDGSEPKYLQTNDTVILNLPVQDKVVSFYFGEQNSLGNVYIDLHSNGVIARGILAANATLLKVDDSIVNLNAGADVLFNASGKVIGYTYY